ncbi:MAG: hypothetical protein FD167_248 [bacterium]|nr:MAG: hypothetical protein FD167_248 [bacterium]
MDYSDNIPYSPTYRSLSEPVYRLRWYFIRLTDGDLAIITLSTVTLMILSDLIGIKQYQIGVFRLDPWGYLGLGLSLTLLISLGHKLRPEGNIELILRGYMSTKLLVTYTKIGDRFWLSSTGKYQRNLSTKSKKKK